MSQPALDPARLAALVADRTRKRALLSDANDRYHAAREARAGVISMKARLAMMADHNGPVARYDAEEQGKALDAEYARLTQLIAATELEAEGYASEAAAASALLKSCTSFAVQNGLPVPEELRREFDPTFAMGAI